MTTLSDLIEQWRKENRAYSMEGTSGVNKFQKLCEAIGYKKGNFLGDEMAILNFLSDNSGAIDALIQWMGEMEIPDWKESIIETLHEPPAENEDEAEA